MNKAKNGILGLDIVLGLTGCGTSWVNVDKTTANDKKINQAEKNVTSIKNYTTLVLKKMEQII